MSKNIVICSDGTGNTAIKGRGTNVFKVFEAVDLHGHHHEKEIPEQIAIYDDGVGTESFKPLKLLGGAIGVGLSRNVKQLYSELCRVYELGDKIYLFGFSRGAFTVRTLAGLISECGILDRQKFQTAAEFRAAVKQAYASHRRNYHSVLARLFRQGDSHSDERFRNLNSVIHAEHAPNGQVKIEFMGVWDTVDAVGLPFDELSRLVNWLIYCFKFHDTKLSPMVEKARHAISIDDERMTFHPVVWDEKEETGSRIEQVWFSGVHTNVGGGYPKQGMSLVPLNWMMQEAAESGLRFIHHDQELYHSHQNVYDKMYNSRSGLAFFYRYNPRNIEKICRNKHAVPQIHISVFERIVLSSQGYAPSNIPFNAKVFETEIPQADVDGISDVIKSGLGRDASLLDRLQTWVFLRRFSYYLVVAAVAIAITGGFIIEYERSGIQSAVGSFFSISGILQIFENLSAIQSIVAKLIISAAVVSYLLSIWGQRKIMQNASEFWYQLVPELREKLHSNPAAPRLKSGNAKSAGTKHSH